MGSISLHDYRVTCELVGKLQLVNNTRLKNGANEIMQNMTNKNNAAISCELTGSALDATGPAFPSSPEKKRAT